MIPMIVQNNPPTWITIVSEVSQSKKAKRFPAI
jgi:hypothetical protein